MSDTYTAAEKLKAIQRELAMRNRVYPRWVGSGKMTAEKAAHELAIFEAIVADYTALLSGKDPI